MEDRFSDDQREKMLQFMTTEHSALQAGRSATIFETGGRTAVFLGTVSSVLVALAFIGQISKLARHSSRLPWCCCPPCSSWAW
jgi:hypothetical protein